MDSVEISKEGYEQLENQLKANQEESGEDSSSNKANLQSAPKGGAPKAQSTEESTISSLTEEEDDTTDLSSLTEDELQELLAEGKITKQQVDNELARRNGSNTESIEE